MNKNIVLFCVFVLVTLCAAIAPSASEQQSTTNSGADADPPYKNPNLSVERRAEDIVARMTLEEKVSQIGHTSDAVPRLGIPEYNWWNEGLHGVARAGDATVFPQAIGLAATFDERLMHEVADVISTEFRAKYVQTLHPDGSADWYRGLTVWSPNINIFRDPRWGRGQETYGEDPYLTARMGIAFVTGLQGNDPKYLKTIATAKHFAVHSGPEATRHSDDVTASRHDMEDTYLPAFRALITEGKADSVMCAYNRINGQPACANDVLLKEHLRGDWGFQGYVVSDCGAVTDIPGGHKFTKTLEEGLSVAFKAGMDLVCGAPRTRTKAERDAMLNAVKQGIMAEATLNQAMLRLFTARIRLGMFDPPSTGPYAKITAADNDTEAHRQLALKTAREAIVLLKNKDGFLPLKKAPSSIAVIGPDADSLDSLIGNYAGTPSKPATVLSGIRKRFPDSKIEYVQGTGLVGPVTKAIPTDALYTDDSRKEHGLKGEYFANLELKDAPVMTRTDAKVDFAWGDTGINHDLPNNYSIRWTGVLVAPESGEFTVGLLGQDGWRFWLDGNLVGEDWNVHHPATIETKTLQLEKDHAYSVKIEYYQTIRSAEARFVWSLPGGQTKEAVDAAAKSDLVVMVLGLSQRIEGEEMKVNAEGFASGDRTKLDLPVPQQQLLEKIYAAGKPVVLVLINGSATSVNWADEHLSAIVEAWYPGEEGGNAVAEALAGDFSPGGRLPVTFYKSVDQLPPFEDYSMAKRTYRYFDGEPLYPFGYGLSYTTFAYKNAKVSRSKISAKDAVSLSVDVTNSGTVAGDEVVQLYLTHEAVAGAPLRALRGFQRIHLDRGQTKTVTFQLHDRDLDIVDPAGKHQVPAGIVTAWLGGGQPGVHVGSTKSAGAQTQFKITTSTTLPD